jgi:predicted enzyme related to lactoylglutathione lyase
MITKIAFVSHPTRDMAASKKFYGEVLGLKQTASHEDKWCEFDTPDGKSIALDTFSPVDTGTYMALETDDIEKEIARLRKRGVKVTLDIMDNKVCKMAIVVDPGGHPVMIHQMEPGRLKALNAAKAAAARPKAKAAGAGRKATRPAKAKAKAAGAGRGATQPAKAKAKAKAAGSGRKATRPAKAKRA